jgi:hypothetical protein
VVVVDGEEYSDRMTMRDCIRVSDFIQRIRRNPQLRLSLHQGYIGLQYLDGRKISSLMEISALVDHLKFLPVIDRILRAVLIDDPGSGRQWNMEIFENQSFGLPLTNDPDLQAKISKIAEILRELR